MPETVINARGLYKEYAGFAAVKRIDFSVFKAECFGFLGPNGAGKTTTMNMVQGYSPLSGGELGIFGMDIRKDDRRIKARIGVVPQENNLDPDLTVLENLRIYARYFDIPKDEATRRAISLLEFMALTEKKDERIPKLSGGMKRRLMVSRALINDPDLIMLDEPTTGLDPQARHLIWQKLRGLKREGRTMVLTTQYMDEAAALCDRLVIMDEGRILDCGTPAELVKKHVKTFVAELRLPEDGVGMVLSALKGLEYDYELSGDTLFIQSNNREGLIEKVTAIAGEGFVNRQATLEDVFLKLTGRELRE
ncbi:MAG: ATP-binding cassette domain-containing protein [Nitrospirota bacterium]